MDKHKKKIIYFTSIMLGALAFIVIGVSITYSYLAVRIKNTESVSTIAVNTGIMEITYNDPSTNNSANIVLNNIIPGVYVDKKFTLTGKNTSDDNSTGVDTNMYYKIGIAVDQNTFSRKALTFKLTKDASSSTNGEMSDNIIGTIPNSGIRWIGEGYFAAPANNVNHVYNLRIEFPETNVDQSVDQGAQFAAHVIISGDRRPLDYTDSAVELIANLCSFDGTECTNEEADLYGLQADPTDDHNVRYVGAAPKNYISFNDELWRIIGVFNVKNSADQTTPAAPKIKIVKDSFLGSFSWDTSDSTLNSGYGVNDWTTSDLMTELNGDYLDTTLTDNTTWYNGHNNAKNGAFDYTKVIKEEYQNMISKSVWNLGGNVYNNPSEPPYGLPTLGQYNAERGTKVYSGRPTTWTGKVGLIYPTDYGYASTDTGCRENLRNGVKYENNAYDYSGATCKNNNWLHNGSWYWTLSPYSGYSFDVFDVDGFGRVGNDSAYGASGVRPSVYLNSDIQILGGTGTRNDPFYLV